MNPPVPDARELIAPSGWRMVDFVSDLHLDAAHPATVRAFADYLAATPADAVFLLGDVFEAWAATASTSA